MSTLLRTAPQVTGLNSNGPLTCPSNIYRPGDVCATTGHCTYNCCSLTKGTSERTWSFVPVEMPRPTCPRACGAFGTARPSRTPCVSITNGTSKRTPRSRLAAGESLIPCVSILADNVRNAFELSSDGDTHCRSAAPACRSSSEPKFRADQAAAGGLRHVLSLTASCALSAIIGIPGMALPAHAITTEQLLFLEAWRAIDRAYVDKGFNNQSWFKVRLIRHDAHAHNRVLLQAQLMFQDCITLLTILLCSYENST